MSTTIEYGILIVIDSNKILLKEISIYSKIQNKDGINLHEINILLTLL